MGVMKLASCPGQIAAGALFNWHAGFSEKSGDEQTYRVLQKILRGEGLCPHLQPVVDFQTGSIYGYEVLSRGTAPLEMPDKLFPFARKYALSDRLDLACCSKALSLLGAQPHLQRNRFFINMNPSSFTDPRFHKLLSPESVASRGLSPQQIVLEFTEGERAEDCGDVAQGVEVFRKMGYQIALDDLGAGYSGIRTMALCSPDYLKLDMELVRNVHEDKRKQKLIQGIRDLALGVNAGLIAEGVEKKAELETLASLGIAYAQGYYFARPEPYHEVESRKGCHSVQSLCGGMLSSREEDLETVETLMERGETAETGSLTVEAVGRFFRRDEARDHLVLLRGGAPSGLLTRNAYALATGGAFGYHLYQKHPVEEIASSSFLRVPRSCSVTEAAKRAMKREREELYNPLVVVDEEGEYAGTVTMRQIIERASTLEVALARSSNPLSGLPGNTSIEGWIREARRSSGDSTLLYLDLDRFKEYNDRYGFLHGDRMISLTASVLRRSLSVFPQGTCLGHVGGDDFVLVSFDRVHPESLEEVCTLFDREKRLLFSAEDLEKGGYRAKTRSGEEKFVPLVTLSCAVVAIPSEDKAAHSEDLSRIVAALKSRVKAETARKRRSFWLFTEQQGRGTEPEGDAVV